MSYSKQYLEEARKRFADTGIHPAHRGESRHNTEFPLTTSDNNMGEVLGWYMGNIFSDVRSDSDFMYRRMTSLDTWARVARALRLHGLKIVDDPSFEGERDRYDWDEKERLG
jgi:hypothetical protein